MVIDIDFIYHIYIRIHIFISFWWKLCLTFPTSDCYGINDIRNVSKQFLVIYCSILFEIYTDLPHSIESYVIKRPLINFHAKISAKDLFNKSNLNDRETLFVCFECERMFFILQHTMLYITSSIRHKEYGTCKWFLKYGKPRILILIFQTLNELWVHYESISITV